MPPTHTVILGPARCGKTHYLVGQYRQILQTTGSDLGRALWLAPTARSAAAIREQLLAAGSLDACLDPGVTTFDMLTRRIVSTTADAPRVISSLQMRTLARRAIDDALAAKRLRYLATMAQRTSFVDLVVELFAELKRHGVAPPAFGRAIPPHRDRRQHEELALLYDGYEQLLVEYKLADAEGQHAAAHDLLKHDDRLLANLKLVVVDGFTDFTHTQLVALEQLAGRAGRLLISLPGEEQRSAGRSELFAKSNHTLAELKLHFPRLTVERLPSRATDWPALDHVADHLFQHPRDIPTPSPAVGESLDRLQIIAAAGVQDEIVAVARSIKTRLAANQPATLPGDVIIVFRNLRDAAPRVREVFDEFGIPYSLESGRPLAATTVVRVLLDLLRVDAEDWPFRRVVSIVANNQLAAADRQERAAAEWLLREMQIDRGRKHLLDRVTALSDAAKALDPETKTHRRSLSHHDRQAQAAATALAFLAELAAAFDGLPIAATPSEWLTALAELATRLKITCLTAARGEPENAAAWRATTEHLLSLEQLALWQDEPPPQLSRADLIDALVDLAQRQSLPRESDDVGRVRVLSAKTARTARAKHVYLVGMSEQAFPSPERAGSFYSAADYRFFAAAADQDRAAAELPDVQRSQEEMLLFYEVLTRAETELTISYPALDEKAQVLPPSPYVTEIERVVEPLQIERDRAAGPSPLPTSGLPLSVTDWRIQSVHEALAKDRNLDLLTGLFRSGEPDTAHALEAGLRIVATRSRRDAFGPAEGLLESDTVRARLARRFGSEHLWSPSQWETYAVCPYRFFTEHVLGLAPLGELVLETDHRRRGSLVHRALAEFHRRAPELLGSDAPLSQHELAKFLTEFDNLLDALIRATPYHGVEAALVQLDRLQIAKWAPRYHAEHGKYDAAWTLDQPLAPTYLEWRFGPPRAGENELEDPRSTDEPFQLQLGKEQIRVTGRIDRIDVGASGGRALYNVLDYKSGRRPTLSKEQVATGQRLQPALYVMAAEALLFAQETSTPLYAGYWSMVNGVSIDARFSLRCSQDLQSTTDDWEALRGQVVEQIGRFVQDIRQGNFPVASRDEHCTSRCEFSTVCRIGQVRSLGKGWFPDEADTSPQTGAD
jgi:ATP-dependent helicase/DNAse subunit B